MGLGSAQQTVTTGANFIPELWGPNVIKATEANLVLAKLIWDWSDPAKGKGDIIHVPNVSNLTTNTKSANSQVTLNAPTEGKVDLTIGTHEECSFLIEDILKAQSSFNLMQYYTEKAGFSVSKSMDTAISTLFASFSQTTGSSGVDLGDQQIRDANELLDIADAPDTGRAIAIYPDQKNALFGIEKYFRADQMGNGASSILTKGKFGEIYGIPVYCTTNLSTSGGARLNAMFHKEALAFARQLGPRVQSQYILEYLGNLVVTDNLFGVIEARDAFGVWMKS